MLVYGISSCVRLFLVARVTRALSKGEDFKTVGLRLKEILGYRCVGSLALPWCLFEYKRAGTSEDGLCVIRVPLIF